MHTLNFSDESFSIVSFHAMKKGILTLIFVGNSGQYNQSIAGVSPWIKPIEGLKPAPHIVSLRDKVVSEWKDNSDTYHGLFYKHLYTMKLQCY